MKQLIADHQSFGTLVDILERQTERLDAGEPSDLEIVELVLAYLQRYGDQCHHPREGLLYARLRALDPVAAARASAIGSEHVWLHEATQEALVQVRRACDGEEIDAGALARKLAEYVSAFRAHVHHENETLFPLALEMLGAADWSALEKDASVMAGAERALRIQERFLALRDYIHRLDRLDPQ